MSNFLILEEKDLSAELETLPDWSVVEGKLQAKFVFLDFRDAFSFISHVAIESEVQNHHPEWSNTYNKVSFSLSTHDAGDKITDLDITMARYISRIATKFIK